MYLLEVPMLGFPHKAAPNKKAENKAKGYFMADSVTCIFFMNTFAWAWLNNYNQWHR